MSRPVAPPAASCVRRWLAAWLCLSCLTFLPAGNAWSQEFNRAAELVRYRAWLTDFKQDLERFSTSRRPLSETELDAMFARSVVPGSRAAAFVRQRFARRGDDGAYFPQMGPRSIFLGVLDSGIPAGQGGLYPETDPALNAADLTVWYLHVDIGDMTNTYLLSDKHFTPYRLPPPRQAGTQCLPVPADGHACRRAAPGWRQQRTLGVDRLPAQCHALNPPCACWR